MIIGKNSKLQSKIGNNRNEVVNSYCNCGYCNCNCGSRAKDTEVTHVKDVYSKNKNNITRNLSL